MAPRLVAQKDNSEHTKLTHQEHVECLDGVGMTTVAKGRKVTEVATRSLIIQDSGGISTEWRKRDGHYCHLQKKLAWAFVHHPVFQSSHCENWARCFLM